jgi:hypothetical protein
VSAVIVDNELAAIAQYVARMNRAQVREVRARILAEVTALFASVNERLESGQVLGDPAIFSIQRDRATAVRRRREADYLQSILDEPLRLRVLRSPDASATRIGALPSLSLFDPAPTPPPGAA